VVKPFSPREVVLRIKAILKRSAAAAPEARRSAVYSYGESRLTIEPEIHRARVGGEALTLTAAEWNILTFLAEHRPQLFSRLQLLESCLGSIAEGSERTIDTHIKNLRRKLGNDGWIETVRGFGYRFNGEPE
jgi:DNA-binding response OmpR family regulator